MVIVSTVASPAERHGAGGARVDAVGGGYRIATPGLVIGKSGSHWLSFAPASHAVLPIPPSGPIQNTSIRLGVRVIAAIGESARATPGLAIGKSG